jgi:hypothetical protein
MAVRNMTKTKATISNYDSFDKFLCKNVIACNPEASSALGQKLILSASSTPTAKYQ